jgi:hypothetical protein|tara:strand:- start:1603 stop:2544 length:942 start_codon:yes stop_codon:yes gene_type:complete
MIDIFNKSYNDTYKLKNTFLHSIKIDAILRIFILYAANLFIPISYNFNNNFKPKKQIDIVVSLTSFPNRISKVHLVIESILRQTYRPRRIILWLSEDQFSSLENLPKSLLKLQVKGLEIYLKPGDIRSYKKYFYFLEENPNEAFIIIDDDTFYPSHMIENLINTHVKFPNAVCANRCLEINDNKPYYKWKHIKEKTLTPRYDLLPTGCGGVLYPVNSLNIDAVNKELFTKLSYDADDIWLNCMAYLNNTPFAYTGKNEYLLTVKKMNNKHLYEKNIGQSNNDYRIELIKEYYMKELGINVFDREISTFNCKTY